MLGLNVGRALDVAMLVANVVGETVETGVYADALLVVKLAGDATAVAVEAMEVALLDALLGRWK